MTVCTFWLFEKGQIFGFSLSKDQLLYIRTSILHYKGKHILGFELYLDGIRHGITYSALYFELYSLLYSIHSFGRVQYDPPFVIGTPPELDDYIKGRWPCPLSLDFLETSATVLALKLRLCVAK